MRAYKLRKLTNTGVALFATATLVISPYFHKEEIPYTNADITDNAIYLEELDYIENNYDFNFKNEELYHIIAAQLGENFTVGDLRTLKRLTINQISNTDLSDLKYLINLEELTINQANINLSDIKYNQSLKRLNIYNSTISNTQDIPNSIECIDYVGVDIIDNDLYIPYSTTSIRINTCLFSSFKLKNPNNLTYFDYNSYSILDLNELSNCHNLVTCNITYSPNIKNAKILATLPNLAYLRLDDYAPIWLDKNTLNSLKCIDEEQKAILLSQIKELDKIAESLVPFEMPVKEKVRNITLNVASRLEYDFKAIEETEEGKKIATIYNRLPITYAIEGQGVCINYACLFTALANRVGLDNYQDFSLDHTWNLVKTNEEYTGYDATNIDGQYATLKDENNNPYTDINQDYVYYFEYNEEELLYYFDFKPDTMQKKDYQGTVDELNTIEEYNIGYVANSFPKSQAEIFQIRLNMAKRMLPLIPIQLVSNIILTIIDKIQSKKKVRR